MSVPIPLRRDFTASRLRGLAKKTKDGCPFRKSYPNVLVMQPSQDRNGDNGARSLDCSVQGRIFL